MRYPPPSPGRGVAMTHAELVALLERARCPVVVYNMAHPKSCEWCQQKDAALSALRTSHTLVPNEPTEEMLEAARKWSYQRYGRYEAVADEGAIGWHKAMLARSKT